MKKHVLVICGDGINCERETARAFEQEGGTAKILHVNEFLMQPKALLEASVFCLPGGFSFGDELRSGKILAEKMRTSLSGIFEEYLGSGGLTLGICNGFQVLIQLGAFNGIQEPRTATLATNDHGRFWNEWVEVEITPHASRSPWFKDMSGTLLLPARHKEGRILPKDEPSAEALCIPLRYTRPFNGAYGNAAALLDRTGRILGMMPHPEAATHGFLNPGLGDAAEENANRMRKLFKNALDWARSQK